MSTTFMPNGPWFHVPGPSTPEVPLTAGCARARRANMGSGLAQTPKFGRLAWLAVTREELALVKLRTSNGITLKAREVIARVPRGELKAVEWHRGYVSPLLIVFGNGDEWHFEVPPANARYGARVVQALGLPVIALKARGAAG